MLCIEWGGAAAAIRARAGRGLICGPDKSRELTHIVYAIQTLDPF
jgi:hypothetical protein